MSGSGCVSASVIASGYLEQFDVVRVYAMRFGMYQDR